MIPLKSPLAIEKLLSAQYKKKIGNLKLSQFLVLCELSDCTYLFHTLTGALFALESDEADALRPDCGQSHPVKSEEEWAASLGASLYVSLCKAHFLVPENADEASEYHYLLKLEKMLHPTAPGYNHFTILPTTACNARCFYCFENGYHAVSLSSQQIEDVCSMIERERSSGTVHLRWFGGEPLLGAPAIRKICRYLSDRRILFDSYIVSNGLLFTPSLIKEAIDSWKLHSVQITLDGTEKEYDLRKAYVSSAIPADGASPFRKVLQNLHALHDAGVRLVLRLNADPDNIDDLFLLLQQLTDEFPDRSGIKIYATPLFAEYSEEHSKVLALVRQCLDLNMQAHHAGFKTNHPYSFDAFRTHMCMADDDNSIVISADGLLTHCEDCRDNTFFGTCTDGITDPMLLQQLRKPADRRTACAECAFLPRCTDYPGCPHEKPEGICKDIMTLRLQYALNHYISHSS